LYIGEFLDLGLQVRTQKVYTFRYLLSIQNNCSDENILRNVKHHHATFLFAHSVQT